MKLQPAVKKLTIIGVIALSITACSSNQVIEQTSTNKVIVNDPVTMQSVTVTETAYEEPEPEVISAVINNGLIDIPVLDNAQIFAEFSDSLPAVINYFTSLAEPQVIDFYKQAFGEAYSQERKHGRLTLKYKQAEEMMRVVISQQDNKRQVDVIINKKS
jgi:hypothetical protein